MPTMFMHIVVKISLQVFMLCAYVCMHLCCISEIFDCGKDSGNIAVTFAE